MNGGSQNLRRFRIAMRDGASIEEAADIAGMTIGEARIHAKRDDENPPPEDAFQLIGHNPKETTMVEVVKRSARASATTSRTFSARRRLSATTSRFSAKS